MAAPRSSPVATLGETLGLIRTDGVGSFAQVGHAAVGIGGSESNVAIALSRLGVPVRWLGRVGDDAFGRRVGRELRAEGVDVRLVVDPDAPTALMLKETPSAGRTVVEYRRAGSAGSRLVPADVELLELESTAHLHVTGITVALSDSSASAVHEAVSRARELGLPVSVDVNYRSRLWPADRARPALRELVARADIVFAGEQEGALVAGEGADPSTVAKALASMGPTEVVVTMGDRGALSLVDDALTERAAVPVTAVDTVGAGDAFVAGYLAARLDGADPAHRLELGSRVAAQVCLHPGDWEGAPYRAELDVEADPVRR